MCVVSVAKERIKRKLLCNCTCYWYYLEHRECRRNRQTFWEVCLFTFLPEVRCVDRGLLKTWYWPWFLQDVAMHASASSISARAPSACFFVFFYNLYICSHTYVHVKPCKNMWAVMGEVCLSTFCQKACRTSRDIKTDK